MNKEVKHYAMILFWIVFSALFVYQAFRQAELSGVETLGIDARIYYEGVHGTEHYRELPAFKAATKQQQDRSGWLYGDVWRILLTPAASILPEREFVGAFTGVMVFAYIVLIWRVVNEVQYGWAIALLITRFTETTVLAGNVAPLLALGITYATGMVVAPCVKLHLFPLSVVCAIGRYFGPWFTERYGAGHGDVHSPDGSCVQTKRENRIHFVHSLLSDVFGKLPSFTVGISHLHDGTKEKP